MGGEERCRRCRWARWARLGKAVALRCGLNDRYPGSNRLNEPNATSKPIPMVMPTTDPAVSPFLNITHRGRLEVPISLARAPIVNTVASVIQDAMRSSGTRGDSSLKKKMDEMASTAADTAVTVSVTPSHFRLSKSSNVARLIASNSGPLFS